MALFPESCALRILSRDWKCSGSCVIFDVSDLAYPNAVLSDRPPGTYVLHHAEIHRKSSTYVQLFKVMFCRVCGFRVRVWESYRTSRSFGYWYENVTEPPEVPGIVARAYRTHGSTGRVRKALYPYPGYCGTGCT